PRPEAGTSTRRRATGVGGSPVVWVRRTCWAGMAAVLMESMIGPCGPAFDGPMSNVSRVGVRPGGAAVDVRPRSGAAGGGPGRVQRRAHRLRQAPPHAPGGAAEG